MNIVDSTGESSCKAREDGDASTGSERPLKKARFAWQVKGKYHLKNESSEPNKHPPLQSTEPSVEDQSTASDSTSATIGNELDDYLLKQDYTLLDTVVTRDNSIITPNTSLSQDKLHYPRYISSYDRKSNNVVRSNSCNSVKTDPMGGDLAEDQCIAQWQARQMVKGCVDNTINRVLESWTNGSLPADDNNSRFLAMDFAEFINHLPGDNSVENEGILMAISAHGLQNTSSSSSNDASNVDNCSTSSEAAFDIASPIRSLSPMLSDEDTRHVNNQPCDTEKKLTNDLPWQYDNQNVDDISPFAFFTEPPQLPYNFFEDNHRNSNIECDGESDTHFDFMNAAVLYAIKSKGLTASGTEYG